MERDETAKRRKALLAQTRSLYRDSEMPAIHPRYRAAYHKIYDDEEEVKDTLGIRMILCVLLFMAFVLMDHEGIDVAQVSTDQITAAVEEETAVQDVWMEIIDSVR